MEYSVFNISAVSMYRYVTLPHLCLTNNCESFNLNIIQILTLCSSDSTLKGEVLPYIVKQQMSSLNKEEAAEDSGDEKNEEKLGESTRDKIKIHKELFFSCLYSVDAF